MVQVLSLLACIWEVCSSKLSWDTEYPDWHFHEFLQSLWIKSPILAKGTIAFFHVLSNSLFTDHPLICRCMFRDDNSAIKNLEWMSSLSVLQAFPVVLIVTCITNIFCHVKADILLQTNGASWSRDSSASIVTRLWRIKVRCSARQRFFSSVRHPGRPPGAYLIPFPVDKSPGAWSEPLA
jgi:hypothetical protein